MKKQTLHEKAVILCEGGVVWHEGHAIRAGVYVGEDSPCDVCNMDCICHMSMAEQCVECNNYDGKKHYLILCGAHK